MTHVIPTGLPDSQVKLQKVGHDQITHLWSLEGVVAADCAVERARALAEKYMKIAKTQESERQTSGGRGYSAE